MSDMAGMLTWMHGWRGLAVGYSAVAAPLLAGLAHGSAQGRKLLAAPALALPLTIVAAGGASIAHSLWAGAGLGAQPVVQLATGLLVSIGIGYSSGRLLARSNAQETVHHRGALIADARPMSPHARRPVRSAGRIRLAGVLLERADETKHFKLIGTTGTGKSTAIQALLDQALARGDRAVIADPDAGYLRRNLQRARGDVSLGPFEPGAAKWDLFAEITSVYDVEQLARSLIPDHEGSDRSWRAYARTFFTAVTRQAHAAGIRDVGELYRLLVIAPSDELRELVAGTPAQPFLDEHNARMFDSIRSVTSSAVGTLEHIAQQQAKRLSVREWVRSGEGAPGVLFIPYRAGQIAALKSQVSAWMRLAIFEAMNRPEGDRPLWFIIDELDALGQIDGLKDALARLRKFGGRCVLGIQSVAQVSSTYGEGDAHTIVENCGNSLILRCSASEGGGTARFVSQLIGEREVIRTTRSRSYRGGDWLGARTLSEHFTREPAVLASEIEQMPDFCGYLKLASRPQWQRVRVEPAGAEQGRSELATAMQAPYTPGPQAEYGA